MKVYRDNKYNNRKMKKKKHRKGITISTAFGAIVIIALNLIPINAAKSENDKIHIETINNVDSIDFKNTDEPLENNRKSSDSDKATNPFKVGSSPDKQMIMNFLASPEGQYVYKYAEQYGVDPYIMAAIAMQETTLNHYACIPGGDMYSGYGVGLMQLESPSGEEIKAYNYNADKWDREYVTMENACDIETNIKIGCMMFQNKLKENFGNIFLAIQSHNYGQGMIDMMMEDLYGKNKIQVMQNYKDTSWLPKIEEIHNNPGIYISGWNESGYGDGKYLEHVLRFCINDEAKFKMGGYEYTVDLKKCELKDKFEYSLANVGKAKR